MLLAHLHTCNSLLPGLCGSLCGRSNTPSHWLSANRSWSTSEKHCSRREKEKVTKLYITHKRLKKVWEILSTFNGTKGGRGGGEVKLFDEFGGN
jgi:hypothetical protein